MGKSMIENIELRRNLEASKRKKAILSELGIEQKPKRSLVTIVPNSPPENVLIELLEIEEQKRKIETDSLKTISRALETKTATCPTCGGSGKTPGKQFTGYDSVGESIYDNTELVCSNCWGEGVIVRKNSERITEMVASKYFPKTNININMNLDKMGRDGLMGFISNA